MHQLLVALLQIKNSDRRQILISIRNHCLLLLLLLLLSENGKLLIVLHLLLEHHLTLLFRIINQNNDSMLVLRLLDHFHAIRIGLRWEFIGRWVG